MIGKTVGELSPFKDIESNKVMLARLQKDGYVRYEDLPLETRDGRHIAVEFVSNVYQAGDKNVIQCNVRDITERKRAESGLDPAGGDCRILGRRHHRQRPERHHHQLESGAQKRFSAIPPPEIVGTSIMQIIPADRQEEENLILETVKSGESVEQFETIRKKKDGQSD